MVKETEYYDILGISPTCDGADIKRAYRKMAIKTHPDKNPGDEQAAQKFQLISEAYQVLSDENLRKRYDELGKEYAQPSEGLEDPIALAASIFGGGAFESYIGEISIVREMVQLGELDQEEDKEEVPGKGTAVPSAVSSETGFETTGAASEQKGSRSTQNPPTKTSTAADPRPNLNESIKRLELHAGSTADRGHTTNIKQDASALQKDSAAAAKQRRKEAIERLEKQNREIREKRVDELTKILIEKISVFTETSMHEEFARNFITKMELEANNLKMESFGLQLLHVIGNIYYTRASLFLKSQKMLGFGGFFGKIKEAGTMVRDVFDAVSAAVEAQNFMNAASEVEKDVSPEKQAELDSIMMGKMLGALWVTSKFEIQGILREVCDRVLHNKEVPLSVRKDRAVALKMMGQVFRTTERTNEEAEEMQFFEQLVAEANTKKAKKIRKDFVAGAAVSAQVNKSAREA